MGKIEHCMQVIQDQISAKKLLSGSRLPSVRQLATQLQYSVSTVVEAYARLVAMDVVNSRPGAGFYVAAEKALLPISDPIQVYDRSVDPLWIARESLIAKSEVLKPGCGWLPETWMPEKSLRKAIKIVSRLETQVLTHYSPPQGHLGLRQLIARKKQSSDIHVHETQILLTDSGTQAIDLIFRWLLQPGDVILIDDPCYFNFHSLLKLHQLHAIAIPLTPSGPDLSDFTDALQFQPKLYLTNSGIHNPTGAIVNSAVAYQVAKLAEQANMLIVEDDVFADFERVAAPKYAALAGLSQVIHIGSFSKTLSASVRCGYIIAEHNSIQSLIDIKIATSFSSARLNAEIIYHALTDSGYRRHLDWINNHLAASMHQCIQALAALEITPWMPPKGGMFLWCELPHNINATALSKICLQHGVVLAPGDSFSQTQRMQNFLRFNVAQCHDKRIFDVLALAMQQCLTMREASERLSV